MKKGSNAIAIRFEQISLNGKLLVNKQKNSIM